MNTELVHEPRRFDDGHADWKREYDDLTDRLSALRRDYAATREALQALLAANLRAWLALRREGRFSEADAMKKALEANGIAIGVANAGGLVQGANWHIPGTMVRYTVRT